ncbi:unnamed protein product [Parnassius mnemosyne]|uniref:THAP-type domain-containing protein n=1 Tax=Parnassius mnemosyne TaxID=213953 RepID=A0AAV1LAD0_9NEOP
MPSCVLRYCVNHSRKISKEQGVTFHTFPGPDHENRESWIQFVQKNRSEKMWLPTKYSRICSAHFKEDDKYITKTGRVYLKKSAVPSDHPTKSPEPEVIEPLSESVSSSDSIFDSPKKIALKKHLRKESATNEKLIEKIMKIQRQNTYLKRKCAFYKTILQNLKDKFNLDLDLNSQNDLMTKVEVINLHKPIIKKNKRSKH